MNSRRYLPYLIAATAMLVMVPVLVHAQANGAVDVDQLRVPILTGDANAFRTLLLKGLGLFLWLAGIAAFFFFLLAGWTYLTAGGDTGAAGKAKNMMVNAIIGIIIIFASYVLVRYVTGTLTGLGGQQLQAPGLNAPSSNNNNTNQSST